MDEIEQYIDRVYIKTERKSEIEVKHKMKRNLVRKPTTISQ
jgi:hypothetical protein